MSEPNYDIQVQIVSQPRYLSVIRELVNAVAAKAGLDARNCSRVVLAVDEALCNVIRHGYEGRDDQPIWIRIAHLDPANPSELTIVIDDLARQIDPATIRGRDLDDIKPHGLGVHLIRQAMDEVEYTRRPGGGMRLRMVKRIASSISSTTSSESPAP
jgi:anti-sigma regulatory factor (Ser/Thr protein kinase)